VRRNICGSLNFLLPWLKQGDGEICYFPALRIHNEEGRMKRREQTRPRSPPPPPDQEDALTTILKTARSPPPKRAYDPSWLLKHDPQEAAAFREWICNSPRIFTDPASCPWLTTSRVRLVRDTLPRDDEADLPLLDQQAALARRMVLSVTGDEE
jgi:hypothetical protein